MTLSAAPTAAVPIHWQGAHASDSASGWAAPAMLGHREARRTQLTSLSTAQADLAAGSTVRCEW